MPTAKFNIFAHFHYFTSPLTCLFLLFHVIIFIVSINNKKYSNAIDLIVEAIWHHGSHGHPATDKHKTTLIEASKWPRGFIKNFVRMRICIMAEDWIRRIHGVLYTIFGLAPTEFLPSSH